jgi:D-alanine-D-alanine ligase
MFIKPSNSGSSVGVKKANNLDELEKAIENAAQYDTKILVEQGIDGKEVECAILECKEENEILASTVGEVMSAEEFYSFDAKYNIPESKTIIPANIENSQIEEIRKLAVTAFKAIDGSGLSRVDFFIEKETNKIYINEINTMPGLTKISMYPKLFEAVGIKYSDLLDKLIENAK